MLLSIPNNIHHPQNHQSYKTASLHSLLLKIGVKTRKHFVISRNRVIFAGNHNLTIHNKDNEWQHLYKERTGEQPEECIIGNPKKQVYRDFRCLRLRQVITGFRHTVCRRPQTICGEPLGIRQTVSRKDEQTEMRLHKGTATGNSHRTESDFQKLSFHSGHKHGDL